ncbi:tRNA nucleotidyltransferase/poly(A) polymerase family protein [Dethiobacter alkaliphilus]|uniref:hypothetical protein n=1 Tax=Dethiobacter alkaliphilus TaxID=427926 RepID=UPI00222656BF|nr:hypothetical protein [Dethiobacter alkaliphilus]MCW3489623.1 hypothetical protein [Dethiobacter alkaliphilus]
MDLLNKFAAEAQKQNLEIYLVGGFLRDLFSGRQSTDMDLTGEPGLISFAVKFAKAHKLSAHLVERHKLLRLTLSGLRLDISEFKGADIGHDLALRDFSVNAMALPLRDYLEQPHSKNTLINPYQGLEDLTRQRLCALPGALRDDPLRVMRGARLALHFGLTPDESTVLEARSVAPLLPDLPGERITAEIFATLQSKCTGYLPLLETLGAARYVFGKPYSAGHDHVMAQTEKLLNANHWPESIRHRLQQNLTRSLSAQTRGYQVLKLAALLCDLDGIVDGISPQTIHHIQKYPLSRQERASLSALQGALDWLWCFGGNLNSRSLYSYYSRFGPAGLDAAVLLRAADGAAARSVAVFLLEKLLPEGNLLVSPPVFMTGRELAAMVGKRRQPASRIGELQKALHRASALEDVATRQEAEEFSLGFVDSRLEN